MKLRRVIALSAATLPLSAILAVGLASPAMACACGGIAPPPGSDLGVSSEEAIVWTAGDQETIELSLGMFGDGDETGLVFPTPAPATVTAGDRADFDAARAAMVPEVVTEDDWWGGVGLAGAGAPPQGPAVLAQVQLGPVQATTLAASDAAGLTAWLDDNSYALSPAVEEQLPGYVARGWYFVALKITSSADLDGGLDPIRFTFESSDIVYPMAMSKAAAHAQAVRLYVLGEHRAQAEHLEDSTPVPEAITTWAGSAPAALSGFGGYLTVLDLSYPDPGTQITGDLALAAAATDDPVAPVVYETHVVTLFGIPVGWLIVAGVVLLFFAGAVVLIVLVLRLALRRRE